MLAGLPSISVSVVRVCLCLSLSKNLLISSSVSKPLLCLCIIIFCSNFFITHKCQIYCQHLLSLRHATCIRQCIIFWVFVAREFVTDRQRYYYVDSDPLTIIIVFLIISHETLPFSKLFCILRWLIKLTA